MKTITVSLLVIVILIANVSSQTFQDILDQATQSAQTHSAPQAIPSCPVGYYFDFGSKQCLVVRCPEGYIFLIDSGQCVKPNSTPSNPPTPTKPSNPSTPTTPSNQFNSPSQANNIFSDIPSSVQTPPCQSNCGLSRTVSNQAELKNLFVKQTVRTQNSFICSDGACYPRSNIVINGAISRDFSQTNNQVKSIDQADIIKTDGSFIYSLSNNIVSIIQAYPLNFLRVFSTINISQRNYQATHLFIDDNYLVVIGKDTLKTHFGLYDISNKACPILINEQYIQGQYLEARKNQRGVFYILTKHQFQDRYNPAPIISFGNRYIGLKDIIYYPGDYEVPVFVNILAFSPSHRAIYARSIITQDSQNIYMSNYNIYFCFSKNQGSSDITTIHKVFVYGTYIIPYADTNIQGSIRNQFYMDQDPQTKILRIATTIRTGIPINNVYCLDFYLNKVGSLSNLAANYQISSARFIGNRVYLVMYSDQSPYFVISLQNHYNPKLLGYFTLSGYTSYLHPYDEYNIIAIGKESSTSTAGVPGLKVALFNVNNPYYPSVSSSIVVPLPSSTSLALIQHKSFLFNPKNKYLVLPITAEQSQQRYSGALPLIFRANQIYAGKIIQHTDNVERSLWIQNILYTKSLCTLQAHDTYSFNFLKSLNLPCYYYQLVNNSFCNQVPGFSNFIQNLPSN